MNLGARMDLEERVRRYAADVVAARSLDDIASVVRFVAGDRHAVFKVTYRHSGGAANHAVVVRVSMRGDVDERARAQREAAVVEQLRGVAAPRLYDFSEDGRWFDTPAMCMAYVDGEHRELSSASHDDLERLGVVVASLHATAVEDLVGKLVAPASMTAYIDQWRDLISSYLPRLRHPLPPSVGSQVQRAQSRVNMVLDRLAAVVRSARQPHRWGSEASIPSRRRARLRSKRRSSRMAR